MEEFTPDDFFDLSHFAHSSLFKEGESVWRALEYLPRYIKERKLRHFSSSLHSTVTLIHPELIFIEEGAIIEPNVYIEGPCIIGKHSLIRHGAYLRKNVLIGEGCVVGHGSEVKHSIFLNGARASHFNYVGDSILGNKVNLGAGVKCANARLDRKEILIYFDGKKIETGLKKFGAVVGDGVQIGCNTVLNPGTLIGKGLSYLPCLSLSGCLFTQGKEP